MQLNIKSEEARRLAMALARETGESLTEAVTTALLDRLGVTLKPVTVAQGHAAREAGARLGKARHAAGLNFGDCFSYALAKTTGESLLFKGGDFSRTDIAAAP